MVNGALLYIVGFAIPVLLFLWRRKSSKVPTQKLPVKETIIELSVSFVISGLSFLVARFLPTSALSNPFSLYIDLLNLFLVGTGMGSMVIGGRLYYHLVSKGENRDGDEWKDKKGVDYPIGA